MNAKDFLVPDWPAPAGVHALCTTRAGGVSTAPFDSLNLGDHVGDAPDAIRANRQILQRALQAETTGARAVFLQQVHGCEVADLQSDTPDGTVADACVSTQAGVACTIMVADCLPVLLAHRHAGAVAAAHAGWRGLAGLQGRGVLESVFERFSALAAVNTAEGALKKGAMRAAAKDTLVWLGPCIGPEAFEVGPEVHAAFCSHDPASAAHFRPTGSGKFMADLAGLARQRLQALGIKQIYGNDSSAQWCTVQNPSRFFSHRRGSALLGGSGRFAACVWRD